MLTATLPFFANNDDSEVAKRIRNGNYDRQALEREDIGEEGGRKLPSNFLLEDVL